MRQIDVDKLNMILDKHSKWLNNIKGGEVADLREADLYGADLREANLCGANLYGADLRGATIDWTIACPSDGAFVAWKKVKGMLVKLLIPEDAERCSATTNKCRCSKALVLNITDIKSGNEVESVMNTHYSTLLYEKGKMVYPDSWDGNRWNECTHGIHFFVDKQAALNW